MPRSDKEKNYFFNKGVQYAAVLVNTNVQMATLLNAQEEDDPDILAGIDAEAFCCEDCGWWVDIGEESSKPGVCDECISPEA